MPATRGPDGRVEDQEGARAPILFVLAGPTCAGKTTLMRMLEPRLPALAFIHTTVTTRPPRPDEVDGVHYRFWSEERFQHAIEHDELIESVETHGYHYGTPRSLIPDHVDSIVIFDLKGAWQAAERLPRVVLIFLRPRLSAVRRRLDARPSITPEETARRWETAQWEVAQASQGRVDYIVPTFEGRKDWMARDVESIVCAERLKVVERTQNGSFTHGRP